MLLRNNHTIIDDTYAREVLTDANRFVKQKKFQLAINVLKTAKDKNFQNKFKGFSFQTI